VRCWNGRKIRREGSKTEKYAFLVPLNTLTFDLPHLQIDYCKSNLLLQTELTVHTGIILSIQQEKADTQGTS